ncbi:MAG: phenylalanine--tRNA ligase subunit beta [Acidobacteriota bacterium]
MKVLLSWIRDFVDVPGAPEEIGARLSMRGLALDALEPVDSLPPPPWRAQAAGDAVLDVDVTANRPDCLSIRGIAREIATVYQLPLRSQGPALPLPGGSGPHDSPSAGEPMPALSVNIEAPELCHRYVAGIADVTVGASPAWLQARLTACGVRPISNVVDVTNYVLLELGQPLHAFDYQRLRGPSIIVRRARAGERLTTLDGKARVLDPETLVIADADAASAIGGVMGGLQSEVAHGTRRIVLESAWFKPQSVRATSKRLGLRTEASYRFERGADVEAADEAMERALALLVAIGAGKARGQIIDCYPEKRVATRLEVAPGSIGHLLGMEVPAADTERILRSLGFVVRAAGDGPGHQAAGGARGGAWHIQVPSWRVDVSRPVDVVEEVGRHYGFEHLPTTFPPVVAPPPPSDPRIERDGRVRRALLGMGFTEAITFAFIEAAAAAPFVDDGVVALANPLSEKFTTLRPSLLPGLVDAVSHNRRHGRGDIRLFEIGTRFSPRGETRAAAAVWTGLATSDHWSGGRRPVDFFDVKGVAEQVCAVLNVSPDIRPMAAAAFERGRAAELNSGGARVGILGQLNIQLATSRELPTADAVFMLELDLDGLSRDLPSTVRFATPLPKYPSVVRDVSVLVDDTLSAETVRGTIRTVSPASLTSVQEFDRYQGQGIPAGKVSLSLRLTFQSSDRTLTDAEIHVAMETIVGALAGQLGAVQR